MATHLQKMKGGVKARRQARNSDRTVRNMVLGQKRLDEKLDRALAERDALCAQVENLEAARAEMQARVEELEAEVGELQSAAEVAP